MGTCAYTETVGYAAMEIGRGWMSSMKREALPSRRESPSLRVSPALVEVLVTHDINRCNLLRCSRPGDGRRREGRAAGQ